MKEVISILVRALVDHPEDVEVEEAPGPRNTVRVQVYVAPSDAGKVIGKNGKVAAALRAVGRAAAAREDKRGIVEIVS